VSSLAIGALTVNSDPSFNDISSLSLNFTQPVNPGVLAFKVKGKYLLNIWGLYCALVTFSLASVVLPFMLLAAALADLSGNSKV
jgi:hypothetical protein